MRFGILILLLTLAGCVGSPEPRNPLKAEKPKTEAWWRASTAGVAQKDNPFEAFVPQKHATTVEPSWPAAVTFPKDWKARKHLNPDEAQKFENMRLRLENKRLKKLLQQLAPQKKKSSRSV